MQEESKNSVIFYSAQISVILIATEKPAVITTAQMRSMDELCNGQHPATPVMGREASALELSYEHCPCQGEEWCDS